MDELTPHLHATIVPIVSMPRQRREREGEKKYETRKGNHVTNPDYYKQQMRQYEEDIGMYPSLHIWTKVGKEEYDDSRSVDYFSPVWQAYDRGKATAYELANEVFTPDEQESKAQARLLGAMGAALTLGSGGVATPHVGRWRWRRLHVP